jgi:hypothetical protein
VRGICAGQHVETSSLQGKGGNYKSGHYDSGDYWPFIREENLLKSHWQFIESIYLSSLVAIAEHIYIYI